MPEGPGSGPPNESSASDAPRRPGDDRPAYALASSGGKDSTLALHRARTRGLRVTHLLSVVDGETGRVPYHGVRDELLAAQADALGLELVQEAAGPDGFEEALVRGLRRLAEAGVRGVVFGNIHLEDIRAWYEERVEGEGLEHVEPLWRGDPARLVREFVHLGYRGRVISINLEDGEPAWLGRDVDADLLEEIADRPDTDPCGERGEFHSFVWDGPLFHRPVRARDGDTMEIEGHRFLDLMPEANGG